MTQPDQRDDTALPKAAESRPLRTGGAVSLLRAEWTLLAAVVVGAALRLDQIREQILLDDEWNTLHAAMRFGYGHLLTQFGVTDRCIPFSLFVKLIADTVGLSEMRIRAPVLLAGIGSLVALPLLLRRWVGAGAATAFAWLLAVSPLHVFYSRFARPYSVSLLLLFAGTLAFLAWWETGKGAWKVGYALCAVLAPYFHLTALPPALAPLFLALAEQAFWRLRNGRAQRSLGETLRLTGLVASGLVLLLGVPLAVDHEAVTYKIGRGRLSAALIAGLLEFLSGTDSPPAWAVLGLLGTAGLVVMIRERPRLALLLLLQSSILPAAALVTRPNFVEAPLVFARYCIMLLPLLLLSAALGLSRFQELLRRWLPLPRGALAALFSFGLLLVGPLPKLRAGPNNWSNHGLFQYSYGRHPLGWACPPEVPAYYGALARRPEGSLRIVEAPWYFPWNYNLYPCYQRVHRQYMSIGFVAGPGGAMSHGGLPRPGELPVLTPGLSFQLHNFLHVFDHAELRRRGIRQVVFHKQLEKEMAGPPATLPDELRTDVERWIGHYRLTYGPPVYEDEWLAVFDVRKAAIGGWVESP